MVLITTIFPRGLMGGGTPRDFRHEDMGGGTSQRDPDTWGGEPPQKSENFKSFSGRKLIKTEVPECPQCIKNNENGAQDLGNNLVDLLGAQDPQK